MELGDDLLLLALRDLDGAVEPQVVEPVSALARVECGDGFAENEDVPQQ